MLVKFTQTYKNVETMVNQNRVDYIEDAGDGQTYIYFGGVCSEGANRIQVMHTIDEVAARLNGEG